MSDEDTATAAPLESLNATEAGIAAAKRLVMQARNINQEQSRDPNKIKWQQAEGSSRPYERSEDVNSSDFKQPYS